MRALGTLALGSACGCSPEGPVHVAASSRLCVVLPRPSLHLATVCGSQVDTEGLYKILGVEKTADQSEIRKAYMKLARKVWGRGGRGLGPGRRGWGVGL